MQFMFSCQTLLDCRRVLAAVQQRLTAVLGSIPKKAFAEFPEAL
jgi:hypothetical protein